MADKVIVEVSEAQEFETDIPVRLYVGVLKEINIKPLPPVPPEYVLLPLVLDAPLPPPP